MKIAMCQLLVEGGEAGRNLKRAEEMIKKAAKEKCDLALLPEAFDLGWTHPSAFKEAQTIPGERSLFLCELAKNQAIWICAGLTEELKGKIYNSAVLIDKEGKIRHKYHKINLLEVEIPFYENGKSLSVVNTPFGEIGINICADNYKESLCLGHALARMGAQIILSPSSWTVDHFITEETDPYKDKWSAPLSALATLYEIPVVSCTSVGYIVGGPYQGKKMIGCSLAVDKYGKITRGEFNEFAGDIKIVDLELGSKKWKGMQFVKMLKEKGAEFF